LIDDPARKIFPHGWAETPKAPVVTFAGLLCWTSIASWSVSAAGTCVTVPTRERKLYKDPVPSYLFARAKAKH